MTQDKLDTLVRACCVCHSIYRPHREEWVNVGEPVYKLIMQEYNVSHSYCKDCADITRAEIKQKKVRHLTFTKSGMVR